MKYQIGDKFYKNNNGRIIEMTIDRIEYHFKGGSFGYNNRYADDKKIEMLLKEKKIFADKSEIINSKIQEKQELINKIQKEIDKLKEV